MHGTKEVMTKESQAKMTPAAALQRLKDGNARFVAGKSLNRDLVAQVKATGAGQYPFASVVACIDSRSAPEIVFDEGIGDIFAPRIAGNFVDEEILGSLEFTAKAAGSKLIVVLGHTECGAVKGACDGVKLGNLTATLAQIEPAVTDRGNGRNVVIFVLESWSGKDIGSLSGDAGVTPVFDELSREGLLFKNFHATGIRTSEGIFSILCSFPNQPYVPILRLDNKRNVFNNQWRSLTQILEDIGYRNVFIHGRDLEFDYLGRFLKYIRFHDVIDRHDFPNFGPGIKDSWPGYNDDEVMQRADEEFSKQTGPFLGIVYTMNTHPPFVTPDNFPRKFPPTSDSNKFLNALHYSDYTLDTFFRLARTRPSSVTSVFPHDTARPYCARR